MDIFKFDEAFFVARQWNIHRYYVDCAFLSDLCLQVLKVHDQSPGCTAGLEQYFDYIVAVNEQRLVKYHIILIYTYISMFIYVPF